MKGTRTYSCWKGLRRRCNYPRDRAWHRYGGRGIRVCDEWNASFVAFFNDMGECPPGCSIDRIDNDGNYEPGNCRWATPLQQARNKSTTVKVVFDGSERPLAEVAELVGMSYDLLHQRVFDGQPVDKAIRIPWSPVIAEQDANPVGQWFPMQASFARFVGVDVSNLNKRIGGAVVVRGWRVYRCPEAKRAA
jgi:hypothetical protein